MMYQAYRKIARWLGGRTSVAASLVWVVLVLFALLGFWVATHPSWLGRALEITMGVVFAGLALWWMVWGHRTYRQRYREQDREQHIREQSVPKRYRY